uniref:Uncharacterized protein n=1 Tax=Arundo donax TaxID=35708 RepID=A0A0A9ES41_ARUDO
MKHLAVVQHFRWLNTMKICNPRSYTCCKKHNKNPDDDF